MSVTPAKQFFAAYAEGVLEVCRASQLTPPALSTDLQRAVEHAFDLAAIDFLPAETFHLLTAIIDNPKMAAVLPECDVDVGGLKRLLDSPGWLRALARRVRAWIYSICPEQIKAPWTENFGLAVAEAAMAGASAERDHIGLLHVVDVLWELDLDLRYLLRQSGLRRLALRRFISHGRLTYSKSGRDPSKSTETVMIRVHNDDFTTKVFVEDVLRQIFSDNDAAQAMQRVHKGEIVLLGPYQRDRAWDLIDAVHRLAEDNEFPLRLAIDGDEDL
jgi:ATP-dependent Clp protease adaptor protein ClpS